MPAVWLQPGQTIDDYWAEQDKLSQQPQQPQYPATPQVQRGLPVGGRYTPEAQAYLDSLEQAPPPDQNGGLGTLFGMGMRQIPAMGAAVGEWAAGQLSDTRGLPAEQQDVAGRVSNWMGEARKSWEDAIAAKAQTLTPEYQAGRMKPWLTGDTEQAAWADPKAILAQFVEALPMTMTSMLPGAWVARAGQAVKAAAVMGGVEGAFGIGEVVQNIADDIEQAPEQELMQSPYYAQLRGRGVSDADARRALIGETQGVLKPIAGGLWSAAAGAAGGYGMGKVFGEEVGRTLGKRVGVGFMSEAPTEAAQGGGTQYITNLAANDRGAGRDPWQGVAESATAEGVIGGLSGGAFGGALGRRPASRHDSTDLTGAGGTELDAVNDALSRMTPPAAVVPTSGLTTPEARQAEIDRLTNPQPPAQAAPAQPAPAQAAPTQPAPAQPAPAATPMGELPPAPNLPVGPESQGQGNLPSAAPVVQLPRFGNEGARKLVTDLADDLRSEVVQILTATPPEGKKGYSQKAVNAAINEARLQRRRRATQDMLETPLPTEYGVEQGGQMRLPNFPLTPEAPQAAPEAQAPVEQNPDQGWLPGMNPRFEAARQRVQAAQGQRNAPQAQAAPAEQTQPAPAAPAPQADVRRKSLAEVFMAPEANTQRQLASETLRTLAADAKTGEQRDLFRALSAMAVDPKHGDKVAAAINTLAAQGLVSEAFVNQLLAAPKAATPATGNAKVAPDNRDTLYQALADRDVTIKAEVGGKEATVTINAADALRDADMLVDALEEMRRVCG